MYSFKKSERLCSKVLIDKLFESKQHIHHPLFKVLWMPIAHSDAPAQVLMVVPKRSIKKAVDRNPIKRRMREAYRLHKHLLYAQLGDAKICLAIIYLPKKESTYAEIEAGIKECLNKLIQKVNAKKSA
jgi:ribonuclease P protein component